MLDFLENLTGSSDRHPLHSVEAAADVIAQLPAKDMLRALGEIAQWLRSVAEAAGFKPSTRFAVVSLLEDAARVPERALLLRYFKDPRPRNASGRVAWSAVHAYWSALAAAYQRAALEELPQVAVIETARSEHAAIASRALRARVGAMRIAMLHYEPLGEAAWQGLYAVFARCEQAGIATAAAHAFPSERYHTTPLLELMNALLVSVAAPERLPPEEVEAAYRIARRFASAARLETAPFEGATHIVDLARGAPPVRLAPGAAALPGTRFFGAPKALANLEHMITNQELFLLDEDERLAAEYSPGQKVTVLRQFTRYWSAQPPLHERGVVRLEGGLSVAHGFHALCQQLPHLSSQAPGQLADQETPEPPETWPERDAGLHIVHAQAGPDAGGWAEVGSLAGIRIHDRKDWWVAAIRRLKPGQGGTLLAEFEVLSRKPFSAWLRILGPEDRMAANWESASGSFRYQHVEVVVLTDAPAKAGGPPMLVLPKGTFVPRQVVELLHGERSRTLKLTEFLEQGKDYDRCAFEWMKGKR